MEKCKLLMNSRRSGQNGDKSDPAFVPSTDEEIRAAIDALNASTEAIDRRTQALTAQRNHAKFFASNQDAINARKTAQIDRAGQKQAAELQHLKFAVSLALRVEELATNLQSRMHSCSNLYMETFGLSLAEWRRK